MKLRLPKNPAHRLILFLSLGTGAALVGTGIIYGISGLGSYDLPREAWRVDSRRQALMRAGAWEKGPPPPENSVSYDDFVALLTPLKPLPSFGDDPRKIPMAEVRRRHKEFAPLIWTLEGLPPGSNFDHGKTAFLTFDFEAKALAKALSYNAVLAARLRDEESALRSLRLMQRLARLQVQSDLLSAISTESLFLRGAVSCAEIWQEDPTALGRIEAMLSDPLAEPDLGAAVRRSEWETRTLLMTSPVNGWTSTGQANDWQTAFDSSIAPAVRFPSFPIPERMLRDAMLARHYEVYAALIPAADSGVGAFDKAEQFIERSIDPPASMSWVFASTPWNGRYGSILRRREARWSAIRSGLAVVLHIQKPLLPDPFRPGHPLRMVRTPDGFTIYSVGEDGKDDHGVLKNSKDVGFEFKIKR